MSEAVSLPEEAVPAPMADPSRRLGALCWLLVGLVVVILAPFADYFTDYQFGFSVFYLVPVLLVSWYVGRVWGVLIAVAATGVWTIVELGVDKACFCSLATYWRIGIRLGVFAMLACLASALSAGIRRERLMARTDALTGAANPRLFVEIARIELARSQRYGRPFTMVYMDVDDFKNVNDQLGHAAGDRVLCQVADMLQRSTRTTDSVARLGGDEFVMLFPETGLPESRALMQKLERLLMETARDEEWPVTFSYGAATFMKAPESVDEMIGQADKLMYQAKRAGKGRTFHRAFGVDGDEPVS